MLTSDSEGFPNVILQAWAARRPVLSCYDPDSLLSRDGLGVYAQDRESLASAVEYFSDERSNSARLNMVAKAYEYVSSHHSTAVIGEQILGLMASQAVAAPLIPSR